MKSNTSSASPALSICFSDVTEASWSPTTWPPCSLPGSVPIAMSTFLSLQGHHRELGKLYAIYVLCQLSRQWSCLLLCQLLSVQQWFPNVLYGQAWLPLPGAVHSTLTASSVCSKTSLIRTCLVFLSFKLIYIYIYISNIIDTERFLTIHCRKLNANVFLTHRRFWPNSQKTTDAHYDLAEAPETSNTHQCSGDSDGAKHSAAREQWR